jgi:hypothetical protein
MAATTPIPPSPTPAASIISLLKLPLQYTLTLLTSALKNHERPQQQSAVDWLRFRRNAYQTSSARWRRGEDEHMDAKELMECGPVSPICSEKRDAAYLVLLGLPNCGSRWLLHQVTFAFLHVTFFLFPFLCFLCLLHNPLPFLSLFLFPAFSALTTSSTFHIPSLCTTQPNPAQLKQLTPLHLLSVRLQLLHPQPTNPRLLGKNRRRRQATMPDQRP